MNRGEWHEQMNSQVIVSRDHDGRVSPWNETDEVSKAGTVWTLLHMQIPADDILKSLAAIRTGWIHQAHCFFRNQEGLAPTGYIFIL